MLNTNDRSLQVVVGFDFSDQAALALKHAIAFCALHETSVLHVIGILEPASGLGRFGSGAKVDFHVAEEAQKAMSDIVDGELEGHDKVSHFVHARIGHAAKEIIKLADEVGADLIVVGTHGRKGVSRFLMGSIAEKVVRNGTCPVFVVRPSVHPVEEIDEALRPEPPCPHCVKHRSETSGAEWWCAVHSEEHGLPHPVSRGVGQAKGLSDNWTRFNR